MSFCKGSVLLLQLLEQPHVLNGDHCLVGESLQDSDLALGEEFSLGPADAYRADRDALSHHGDTELCPGVALPREVAALWELVGLARQVSDVDSSSL